MKLVLVAGLLLLSGCASTTANYFPITSPPDFDQSCKIEILSGAPERPHIAIGLIKIRQGSKAMGNNSPEYLMFLLKEEAWLAGADAVILEGVSGSASIGQDIITGFIRTTHRDIISGVAIAWTEN